MNTLNIIEFLAVINLIIVAAIFIMYIDGKTNLGFPGLIVAASIIVTLRSNHNNFADTLEYQADVEKYGTIPVQTITIVNGVSDTTITYKLNKSITH